MNASLCVCVSACENKEVGREREREAIVTFECSSSHNIDTLTTFSYFSAKIQERFSILKN